VRVTKIGKTYQLRIETAQDLADALALDESLWVATSAPVAAFSCEPRFLTLVDTDANGRIYTNELKAAIQWLLDRLADHSHVAEGTDRLPLAAIASDTPGGDALLRSARYVLDSLGKRDTGNISLADVREFAANVRSRPLNGDGVIVPAAAANAELMSFIQDIVKCLGGTEDASGQRGISEDDLNRFIAAVRDFLEWKSRAEIPPGQSAGHIMTLGEETPEAYRLYQEHADKVDMFFALGNLGRFWPDASDVTGPPAPGSVPVSSLGDLRESLKEAPLALPTPDCTLPLSEDQINPYYRRWISSLKEKVLRTALGSVPPQLSEADWNRAKSVLAPYAAYLADKKGAEIEVLTVEKARNYLDSRLEGQLRELIQRDKDVATVLEGIQELERLLLYHQNLLRLANNFVSFPELYAVDRDALFEMGSTIIDGRWFNFAVRVDDPSRHSATAELSNIFTFYLEITGAAPNENYYVAVPATAGTKGNLSVGKRGVFFDTTGKEFDARIVNIIENPISMLEAMGAPFVRVWRLVVGKIESLAGKAQKRLEQGVEKTVAVAQQAAASPPVQQPAQPAATGLAGPAALMASIGLTIAALSSAFAYIVTKFSEIGPWRAAYGVLGAALIVFIPVAVVAAMKFRRQDLSALLEGCGWAINARMRLTRSQRKHFTRSVPYPKEAEGTRGSRLARVLLVLLALGAITAAVYYGHAAFKQKWRPQQTQPAGPQEARPQETVPPENAAPIQEQGEPPREGASPAVP